MANLGIINFVNDDFIYSYILNSPFFSFFLKIIVYLMSTLKKTKRNHIIMDAYKKKEIVIFMLQNPSKTQFDVAKHFSEKFNHPVCRRTVGDINRDKEKWLNCKNNNHLIQSSAKFPKLEEALTVWMHNARENNFILTDEMIIHKAKTLGEILNIPEDFQYSSGWLYRFKKRNGILQKVLVSGETPNNGDFDFIRTAKIEIPTDDDDLIKTSQVTIQEAKNSLHCLQDFFNQQSMSTVSDIQILSKLSEKVHLIELEYKKFHSEMGYFPNN